MTAEVVRAAFDIGSGATKVCVARVVLNAAVVPPPPPTVLHEEEVSILLRQDLAARGDGAIGAEMLARCASEIERMQTLARHLGASQFAAVATAVFREASNGGAFVERTLRARLGLNVAIVSQELEGELGHRTAVALAAPLGLAPTDVVSYDSGGGSFQVTACWAPGGAGAGDGAERYECCEGQMGSSNALALMLGLQGRELAEGATPNPSSAADVASMRAALAAKLAETPVPEGLCARLREAASGGAARVIAIGGLTCMFNTARLAVALTRHGAGEEAAEPGQPFSADDVACAVDALHGRTDAELEDCAFPQPYMVITKLLLLESVLRALGGDAALCVRYCPSTGSTLGMFSVARLWAAEATRAMASADGGAPAPPGAFASAAAVQAQGREVSQLQLFSAAAAGDLSSLEAALGSGATVGAANVDGATSLHVAVEAGHEATVGRLLEAGAAVGAANAKGWTPLYIAAQEGLEAVVVRLLEAGAAVDQANEGGWTPLLIAASSHRPSAGAVVGRLLAAGAAVDQLLQQGRLMLTPLRNAVRQGRGEIVGRLLEGGAAVDQPGRDGTTPLHVAAHHGYEAVVGQLLAAGAVVNQADEFGETAMYKAASQGRKAVVEQLLEGGAAVHIANFDLETPLRMAAQAGHEAVVQLLLEAGATVDQVDTFGISALSAAESNGHAAIAAMLRNPQSCAVPAPEAEEASCGGACSEDCGNVAVLPAAMAADGGDGSSSDG